MNEEDRGATIGRRSSDKSIGAGKSHPYLFLTDIHGDIPASRRQRTREVTRSRDSAAYEKAHMYIYTSERCAFSLPFPERAPPFLLYHPLSSTRRQGANFFLSLPLSFLLLPPSLLSIVTGARPSTTLPTFHRVLA